MFISYEPTLCLHSYGEQSVYILVVQPSVNILIEQHSVYTLMEQPSVYIHMVQHSVYFLMEQPSVYIL